MPKMRPGAADERRIIRMREAIRREAGAGGQCSEVVFWLSRTFGWEGVSGVYTTPGDEPIIDHVWAELPDGAILDATADQIGEGHDGVRIVPPGHPDHGRYRWEWTADFNPDTHPAEAGERSWTGERDLERMTRLRAERGDGWWLADRVFLDAYRAREAAYGETERPGAAGPGR